MFPSKTSLALILALFHLATSTGVLRLDDNGSKTSSALMVHLVKRAATPEYIMSAITSPRLRQAAMGYMMSRQIRLNPAQNMDAERVQALTKMAVGRITNDVRSYVRESAPMGGAATEVLRHRFQFVFQMILMLAMFQLDQRFAALRNDIRNQIQSGVAHIVGTLGHALSQKQPDVKSKVRHLTQLATLLSQASQKICSIERMQLVNEATTFARTVVDHIAKGLMQTAMQLVYAAPDQQTAPAQPACGAPIKHDELRRRRRRLLEQKQKSPGKAGSKALPRGAKPSGGRSSWAASVPTV